MKLLRMVMYCVMVLANFNVDIFASFSPNPINPMLGSAGQQPVQPVITEKSFRANFNENSTITISLYQGEIIHNAVLNKVEASVANVISYGLADMALHFNGINSYNDLLPAILTNPAIQQAFPPIMNFLLNSQGGDFPIDKVVLLVQGMQDSFTVKLRGDTDSLLAEFLDRMDEYEGMYQLYDKYQIVMSDPITEGNESIFKIGNNFPAEN